MDKKTTFRNSSILVFQCLLLAYAWDIEQRQHAITYDVSMHCFHHLFWSRGAEVISVELAKLFNPLE